MSAIKARTLVEVILRNTESLADKTVLRVPVRWEGPRVLEYDTHTFAQFGEAITAYRRGLQSRGLQKNDRVIVLFRPGFELYLPSVRAVLQA